MTPPSIALLFLAAALIVACGPAGTDGAWNPFKILPEKNLNNTKTQTTKAVDSTTVAPTTLKSKGNFGKLKSNKTTTTTTPKSPEVQSTKILPVKPNEKETYKPSPQPTTSENQEESTPIPIPIIFYSPEGYGDYNPLSPNAFQTPYGNYFPPQPYNPYALWKMYPWAEQPLADLSASVPWSPSFQRQVRSPYPSAPLYPYPWYAQPSYYYPPPPPPLNSPCSHSSHKHELNKLDGVEMKHSQHHDHHHTTTTTEKPDDPNPTRISLTQPTQSESHSHEQSEDNVPYYPYYQNYDNMYNPQYVGFQQPMYDYQQYAYNNYYQQNAHQAKGDISNKEKQHGKHKRHHRHRS